MNIEKISQWFSVVTNIGVLAGVALLVIELNQNTSALNVQTDNVIWSHWISLNQLVATSPDLAEIIEKGNKTPNELTSSEYIRYSQYLFNVLNVSEHNLRSIENSYSSAASEPIAVVLKTLMNNPGALNWWTENKILFQPDFVAWADGVLSLE